MLNTPLITDVKKVHVEWILQYSTYPGVQRKAAVCNNVLCYWRVNVTVSDYRQHTQHNSGDEQTPTLTLAHKLEGDKGLLVVSLVPVGVQNTHVRQANLD